MLGVRGRVRGWRERGIPLTPRTALTPHRRLRRLRRLGRGSYTLVLPNPAGYPPSGWRTAAPLVISPEELRGDLARVRVRVGVGVRVRVCVRVGDGIRIKVGT